uniref:Uncharacterized protein n=1 Tax=Triticum urartu TaxID=4572 RepID=A0A8R7V8P5_TRIUA
MGGLAMEQVLRIGTCHEQAPNAEPVRLQPAGIGHLNEQLDRGGAVLLRVGTDECIPRAHRLAPDAGEDAVGVKQAPASPVGCHQCVWHLVAGGIQASPNGEGVQLPQPGQLRQAGARRQDAQNGDLVGRHAAVFFDLHVHVSQQPERRFGLAVPRVRAEHHVPGHDGRGLWEHALGVPELAALGVHVDQHVAHPRSRVPSGLDREAMHRPARLRPPERGAHWEHRHQRRLVHHPAKRHQAVPKQLQTAPRVAGECRHERVPGHEVPGRIRNSAEHLLGVLDAAAPAVHRDEGVADEGVAGQAELGGERVDLAPRGGGAAAEESAGPGSGRQREPVGSEALRGGEERRQEREGGGMAAGPGVVGEEGVPLRERRGNGLRRRRRRLACVRLCAVGKRREVDGGGHGVSSACLS